MSGKALILAILIENWFPNEYQLIATNPVSSKIYLIELSQSYKEAVVIRIIIQEKICRHLDCAHLKDRYYCTDEDSLNATELKRDGSIQVTCLNPDRKIKFPFGVVAADNLLKDNRKCLFLSDFKSHSVMEIDEDALELNVSVGQYDNPEFDYGPTQSGLPHSSVRITCRGSSVYITEYSSDRQGSIRLFQYLAGFKSFSQYGTWLARPLGWL